MNQIKSLSWDPMNITKFQLDMIQRNDNLIPSKLRSATIFLVSSFQSLLEKKLIHWSVK